MARKKEVEGSVRVLVVLLIVLALLFTVTTFYAVSFPARGIQLSGDENLVLHYRFEDNLNDRSGNGYDGELVGATYVSSMSGLGKAIKFDGNDYVSSSEELDLGNPLTISGWIKLDKLTGELTSQDFQFLINKGNPGDYSSYSLQVNKNNQLGFNIRNVNNADSLQNVRTVSSLDKNWHFFAAVLDGTSLKIYLDGKLESQKDIPRVGPYANPFPVTIGGVIAGDGNLASGLHGSLDDLRMYDVALNSDEIVQAYNLVKRDVQLAYSFDNPNKPALDESGNGYNGTVNGGESVGGVIGKRAYSMSEDYINVGVPLNLDEFTIGVWVKLDRPSNSTYKQRIISKGQQGSYWDSYILLVDENNKATLRVAGENSQGAIKSVSSDTTLEVGKWYYIVGSLGGGILKLHVNGNLEKSLDIGSVEPYDSDLSPFIGAGRASDGNPWDTTYLFGDLDDLKVWNKAIGLDEIKTNYEKTLQAHQDLDTPQGGAEVVNGVILNALRFNGNEGDGIATGVGDDLDFQQLTISAWIRINESQIGTLRTIVSDAVSGSNPPSAQMHIDAGEHFGFLYRGINGSNLGINTGSMNSVDGLEKTLASDRWYHVVAVVDKEYVRLYLDGTEVARNKHWGNTPYSVDNEFIVGALKNSGGYQDGFNGDIDDVLIYSVPLTSSQILNEYDNRRVLQYDFEDGRAVDLSSYAHDGSVNGVSRDSDGVEGDSAEFDGDGDYINSNQPLNLGEEFGINIWFNVGNKTSDIESERQIILSKYAGSAKNFSSYRLYLNNNDELVFDIHNFNSSESYRSVRTSNFSLSAGEWHMVSVTVERGELKLYVDKVLEDSLQLENYEPYDSTNPLYLGTEEVDGKRIDYYNGLMDEFIVYTTMLTQNDIDGLYDDPGSGGVDGGGSGGCESYWVCEWGDCIGGFKTRTCYDANNCVSPTGRPADETVACDGSSGGSDSVCGNGLLESGEECDDGNNDSGDGCSSSCRSEETSGGGSLTGVSLIIIWIVLLVGIVVVGVLIFLKLRKKKSGSKGNVYSSSGPNNKGMPPRSGSSPYNSSSVRITGNRGYK